MESQPNKVSLLPPRPFQASSVSNILEKWREVRSLSVETMGLLAIRKERGDPSRPQLAGSCLSAEPSVTEYRENESSMRAEYVYQPVSNSGSKIKQPRICMLWVLICPFRAVTGYEHRERKIWVQWAAMYIHIYPCASFSQGLSIGVLSSYFSQNPCANKKKETERETFLFPFHKDHLTVLRRWQGSWWNLSSSLKQLSTLTSQPSLLPREWVGKGLCFSLELGHHESRFSVFKNPSPWWQKRNQMFVLWGPESKMEVKMNIKKQNIRTLWVAIDLRYCEFIYSFYAALHYESQCLRPWSAFWKVICRL